MKTTTIGNGYIGPVSGACPAEPRPDAVVAGNPAAALTIVTGLKAPVIFGGRNRFLPGAMTTAASERHGIDHAILARVGS